MPNRAFLVISLFIFLTGNFKFCRRAKTCPRPKNRVLRAKSPKAKKIEIATNSTPETANQPAEKATEVSPEKPVAADSTTQENVIEATPKVGILPERNSNVTEKTAERSVSASSNSFAPISRVGVQTGQTLTLTLTDAVRRALENNNDIEIARNDVKISETTLRSLQGVYDPVFTITPTFSRSGRNGTSATNNFSANAGFSQLFQDGGGSIQPFFNNSQNGTLFNTNSNGTTTQNVTTGSFYNSALGVSFTQPLFRNRGIDNTRRQIRIQRKRLEQSDADFRRRTIEVIAQVQRAYWDLVFALRDQQNRVENLNLSKENLRRVEAQITAGSAAPLQRAEVETELANRETDVLLAAQQVSISENTLKNLFLKNPDSAEWQTPLVPTDQPVFDTTPVNLDDALKTAQSNRPELSRLKLQKDINAIDISYFKNQLKPRIDLNTSFSLNGYAQNIPGISNTPITFNSPLISGDPNTSASAFLLQQINLIRPAGTPLITSPTVTTTTAASSINGGYNQAFGNLFSTNAPSFSVGVTLNFPLRNTTAKADLAGAQYQQTQIDAQTRLQEQTIVVEVRNAVQGVETARQRILTARRARENAEIQLAGEQKLFDVGRSTTFLLFQRENTLTNARNSEIRAQNRLQ